MGKGMEAFGTVSGTYECLIVRVHTTASHPLGSLSKLQAVIPCPNFLFSGLTLPLGFKLSSHVCASDPSPTQTLKNSPSLRDLFQN